MADAYVDRRDGGYWITGTRVSLDSLVYAFLSGASPESIAQSFPVLSLEQVYGGITYYLAHQKELDAYLQQGDREFSALQKQSRESNSLLYRKLEESRRQLQANRK
jgi:uncharacterized protein (DUF433 family)